VKALALGATESGPFIELTKATVANRSYPLTRTVYMFLNKDRLKSVLQTEFLRYILSREGQAGVERQDIYLPLTAAAAREQLLKLTD
jgi:phosphate transport system substrate-binding protein